MIIGVHNSINGGIINSIRECKYLKTNATQMFLHSPRVWRFERIERETIELFKAEYRRANLRCLIVHSSYLINPISDNPKTLSKSLSLLREEISTSDLIEADYYVMHIRGSRKVSFNQSIKMLKEFIKRLGSFKTKILIENSASGIGSSVENIRIIYSEMSDKISGICIDTAHLFEAGYDIRTKEGLERLIYEVEDVRIINLIHLNDSKTDLNSHIDRHHHIGKGMIRLDGFRNFFSQRHFSTLPIILETPRRSLKDDVKNLDVVRGMFSLSSQP